MTSPSDNQPHAVSGDALAGDTTRHVRRALGGDRDSLGWVVARFAPLLRMQAEHRLGPILRRRLDPDDIVSEAWLVVLRRIGDLADASSHSTPRLLAFVGETVRRIINHQLELCIRRKDLSPVFSSDGGEATVGGDPLARQAAEITGAVTQAVRDERHAAVAACLARLSEEDRQVVVLRGIEGCTNQEAAEELGEQPNTVSHRYRRALEKLRKALPQSIFDELVE